MATVIGKDDRLVKRCTCRNCASIIEYTESELRSYRTSYQGDTCTEWALQCPTCKYSIVVRSD